jgi:hypothetical protein
MWDMKRHGIDGRNSIKNAGRRRQSTSEELKK